MTEICLVYILEESHTNENLSLFCLQDEEELHLLYV